MVNAGDLLHYLANRLPPFGATKSLRRTERGQPAHNNRGDDRLSVPGERIARGLMPQRRAARRKPNGPAHLCRASGTLGRSNLSR